MAVKIIVLTCDRETNDRMNSIPFEFRTVVSVAICRAVIPMKARDKFPQANNTVLQSFNIFSAKLKHFSIMIIIIIIVQFNSLLFMCRFNSYKANYRHSTI
jgi:hypothetical protein